MQYCLCSVFILLNKGIVSWNLWNHKINIFLVNPCVSTGANSKLQFRTHKSRTVDKCAQKQCNGHRTSQIPIRLYQASATAQSQNNMSRAT
uniref:Uncharacterized protein n=1 Tax=Anguilla anguilla TaxID=7936 RepID=A0A0E9XYF4_ANGAN